MKIYKANIFDYLLDCHICVTTNGSVKKNGEAVLGRGNALEATWYIPRLKNHIGVDNKEYGTVVHYYPNWKLFAFPVKYKWHQHANLDLIRNSCKQLVHYIKEYKIDKVLLPVPGVGNGKRCIADVMPILDQEFKGYEDRIFLVLRTDLKRKTMPEVSNAGGTVR